MRRRVKIAVVCCVSIREEMSRAIEGLQDVDIDLRCYSMSCGQSGAKQSRISDLLDDPGSYDMVLLFGSYCIRDIDDDISINLKEFKSCFLPIIDEDVMDHLTRNGAYLITPGWLMNWKERIDEWGFDRRTAIEYFHESIKEIVLLDTFTVVDPEVKLREFSEFLDLPCRTIPVGISKMRYRISEEKRELEYRMKKDESERIIDTFKRKLSDLTMAQDVFSILSDVSSESKVIMDFLRFYSMLFAAEDVVMEDDRNHRFSFNEGGFEGEPDLVSAINHQGRIIGTIKIYGIRFPEHRNSYRTILDGLSNVQGLAISNARNFDELLRSRNELEDMNRKLMEMDDIRKQYISILAHDIGSPISTLLLTLQLIREGKFGPVEKAMRLQVDRSLELLENVMRLRTETLILNRMDLNSLVLEREPVKLHDMIDEVISRFRMEIDEGEIDVSNEVAPDLTVEVDGKKFVNVLSNLLSNAIRYSDGGGYVVIGSSVNDEGTAISITDNGRGIEEKDLERIFERFYRSGEKVEGSTGLGLSIVRELVKAHGGTVKAESDGIGTGSHFTIFLPFGDD